MKKYQVLLTRDYVVEINAKNKKEAKECVEYFVSGVSDVSTLQERKRYNFSIERIKPTINDAFEIEEITHE